jgi:hypothetical protein
MGVALKRRRPRRITVNSLHVLQLCVRVNLTGIENPNCISVDSMALRVPLATVILGQIHLSYKFSFCLSTSLFNGSPSLLQSPCPSVPQSAAQHI